MSKWVIGTLLFVVATITWAQTRKSDPRLQYVGAITINSANPKALSGWYTEKLGLDASSEYHGLYYGSFSTKSGDFNLGIHPIPAGAKVGTPNISITFRKRGHHLGRVSRRASAQQLVGCAGGTGHKHSGAGHLDRLAFV
jgi:hypothetical protein